LTLPSSDLCISTSDCTSAELMLVDGTDCVCETNTFNFNTVIKATNAT
jgi:hypothetical protein